MNFDVIYFISLVGIRRTFCADDLFTYFFWKTVKYLVWFTLLIDLIDYNFISEREKKMMNFDVIYLIMLVLLQRILLIDDLFTYFFRKTVKYLVWFTLLIDLIDYRTVQYRDSACGFQPLVGDVKVIWPISCCGNVFVEDWMDVWSKSAGDIGFPSVFVGWGWWGCYVVLHAFVVHWCAGRWWIVFVESHEKIILSESWQQPFLFAS